MLENLLKEIVGKVNVDSDQANGGLSVLFDVAKDVIGAENFSKLIESLGAEKLVKNAPEEGFLGGLVDVALDAFGQSDSTFGAVAKIISGFKDLGIDLEDIQSFVTTVLNFVEENIGSDVKDSMQSLLPSEALAN